MLQMFLRSVSYCSCFLAVVTTFLCNFLNPFDYCTVVQKPTTVVLIIAVTLTLQL